jgi:hypothetical protein
MLVRYDCGGGETYIELFLSFSNVEHILMIMEIGYQSLFELLFYQTEEATSKYTFLHRIFVWVRSKRTRRRLEASK